MTDRDTAPHPVHAADRGGIAGTPLAEIDLQGRRWHAVVVKPLVQSGPIALQALQVRGWQVLRPMCRELVTRKGQRIEEQRTLFGRYVFAGAAPRHEAHELRFVPGVQHPVLDGKRRPLLLRPAVIAAVLARLQADGGVADLVPREAEPLFRPGQAVRVLDGSFAGYEGLFEGDENQRVRVLLSLFGGQVTIRVKPTAIEVAD